MAKTESVQKRLTRVRPPRVQMTYDVEIGDTLENKELPFVVGVVGDFGGNPDADKTRLKDRLFVGIDVENFDEVIGREIARKNAREKIWALEGYLLRERLADEAAAARGQNDAVQVA